MSDLPSPLNFCPPLLNGGKILFWMFALKIREIYKDNYYISIWEISKQMATILACNSPELGYLDLSSHVVSHQIFPIVTFIFSKQCLVSFLLKIVLPRREYVDSEWKLYTSISLLTWLIFSKKSSFPVYFLAPNRLMKSFCLFPFY